MNRQILQNINLKDKWGEEEDRKRKGGNQKQQFTRIKDKEIKGNKLCILTEKKFHIAESIYQIDDFPSYPVTCIHTPRVADLHRCNNRSN